MQLAHKSPAVRHVVAAFVVVMLAIVAPSLASAADFSPVTSSDARVHRASGASDAAGPAHRQALWVGLGLVAAGSGVIYTVRQRNANA